MYTTPSNDDLTLFAYTQSSRVARREQAIAIGALMKRASEWLRLRFEHDRPVSAEPACGH